MQTKIDCANRVVTVSCGDCSPCDEKNQTVVRRSNKRRPITDDLVAKWAVSWHGGKTFYDIAEDTGFSQTVVSFNVYKHLAFMQAEKIKELEAEIKDLRLQNKRLREKNKGLN